MKIIVAGNGKVGSLITKQLTQEGYDLTIIDINSDVLGKIEEQYDTMCVQGNCASMDVLLSAGVKEADLLIATTGADELNLLCSLTAHGLNSKIHTIARIRNPEYTEQIYKMRDVFALSMIVNPERMVAAEIEHLLRYPGFLKREPFARGRVEIVELRVDEDSILKDVSLNELNNLIKSKVLVCAVLRDGKSISPTGDFVCKVGDRLFVTASNSSLSTLLHNLGLIHHRAKNVIICGGGRIAYYLAQILEKSGITTKIIEQDYQKCVNLASLLPDTAIIHGDASSEVVLQREGIDDCDAVITLTGVDELNVMLSIFAKKSKVPQVITKVGRLESNSMINDFSLGSIVSPKELCCNNIVRYVRALKNQTGAAISVHKIADGQAEALEFRADETTLHLGEPLKKVGTKQNVLLASISRNSKNIIPNGDTTIEKGDTIVVVKSGDQLIHQLNDIFE